MAQQRRNVKSADRRRQPRLTEECMEPSDRSLAVTEQLICASQPPFRFQALHFVLPFLGGVEHAAESFACGLYVTGLQG
jgi:hypothetical protein